MYVLHFCLFISIKIQIHIHIHTLKIKADTQYANIHKLTLSSFLNEIHAVVNESNPSKYIVVATKQPPNTNEMCIPYVLLQNIDKIVLFDISNLLLGTFIFNVLSRIVSGHIFQNVKYYPIPMIIQ